MTLSIGDLRRIDLFDEVPDEELEPWIAAARERRLAAGERIVEHGDVDVPFRLLLEGTLAMQVLLDGREGQEYAHVAPTWLGAMIAVTGEPSTFALQAAEPAWVADIDPDVFRDLLFRTPVAFRRVMRTFRPVLARLEGATLQREKLAALGRMSAGLAHELNNPAAAAKRTAAALADALDVLGGVIGTFVESGIERTEAEALVGLQRRALAQASAVGEPGGLAAADAEEEMADRLAERGVGDAWQIAEPLAAAGLDAAWLDDVERLAGPAFPAAVRWVATSITARALADDLREATGRMSALVQAIKAYTYMDRPALQEVDVHEGLDATLTILGHKLKHTGIVVERRYAEDLPRVCVHGSELNQVWTNLLDNAIDALGEHGTITVTTAPWGDGGIEVRVADDGPGIPEEARRHVFEPFFTTKGVGAGTGLGLDTTLRIVRDRHDGDVRVESRPGETVFTVRLPRKPQRPAGDGAPAARA